MQYRMSRVLAGPFLRLLGRPEITGSEHIPASGGAILASNHLSIVDSIFLPLMVDRPVTFAAKSEYFTGTRPIDRLTGAYLRATNQLSVDRAGARAGAGHAGGGAGPAAARERCSASTRGDQVAGRAAVPGPDRRRLAGAQLGRCR